MNKNAELENAQLLEAVLKPGVSLPSPGKFLPALQRAGSHDRAGVKEFADAVRGDPAIVGSVMRVANCIVFRPPRKSETLEQAISCIGYAKLLAITSSVALNGYIDLLDPALRESVQLVFDDSNRAADIYFCTADKAKGLEFEQVWLPDDFMRFFENGCELRPDQVDQEEVNILYVALTRARAAIRLNESFDDWLRHRRLLPG